MNTMYKIPRIMLAAPASGSGKTMITCGLIKLLMEQRKVRAFKCGPDYIDPMFHRIVLKVPSMNLDSFMADPESVRKSLYRACMDDHDRTRITVIEGVMGYYDGLGGCTVSASTYEISKITDTPVIIVINARGMSLSAMAVLKGLLQYKSDSNIKGVILNRTSKHVYDKLAPLIEDELHIKACGYVPETRSINFPGRHLGLVMPAEIDDIEDRIREFAGLLSVTLDMKSILDIADSAPPFQVSDRRTSYIRDEEDTDTKIRIGIAMDEAFCFYYMENLDILEENGAELVYFSPLHDREIPAGVDALYMGGGYPEYHTEELSSNRTMISSIRKAADEGMPVLAECGAYMYLHEAMQGMDDVIRPCVGIFKGSAVRRSHPVNFGYQVITSTCETILGPEGKSFRVHEFHYYDTTEKGDIFIAQKPVTCSSHTCMKKYRNTLGGFPHFYFAGEPDAAESFIDAGVRYRHQRLKERERNQADRVD